MASNQSVALEYWGPKKKILFNMKLDLILPIAK